MNTQFSHQKHSFSTKNVQFLFPKLNFFTATVLLEVQLNTRLPLLKAALSLLSADVNQKMAQWKMRPYQLFSCQLKYYHHYSRITKSDGFTLELWNFGDWIFLSINCIFFYNFVVFFLHFSFRLFVFCHFYSFSSLAHPGASPQLTVLEVFVISRLLLICLRVLKHIFLRKSLKFVSES